jgi:hypothetical protein
VLRRLAGEIVEVSAFARRDEADAAGPVLLAGCFERGGMFRMTLLPEQPEARWHLKVLFRDDSAELIFPEGWPGPATFRCRDERGQPQQQDWENWNPWPHLVEAFEATLEARAPASVGDEPAGATPAPAAISWRDEVRCLELDDAARRSIERRRSSVLEYQEAVEEASFKGTMTLVGCGLLWASLALLLLSIWVPYLGWLIVPLIVFFLSLQFLRWFVAPPAQRAKPSASREDTPSPARDEHIQPSRHTRS